MHKTSDLVLQEWTDNNQIVIFTLQSASIDSIETWSNQALETIIDWDKDFPYHAVHDLSASGVGLVYMMAVQYDIFNIAIIPERKATIDSLLAEQNDWTIKLALVVSPSMSGHIARLRLSNPVSEHDRILSKVFFNREQAITWLRSE